MRITLCNKLFVSTSRIAKLLLYITIMSINFETNFSLALQEFLFNFLFRSVISKFPRKTLFLLNANIKTQIEKFDLSLI